MKKKEKKTKIRKKHHIHLFTVGVVLMDLVIIAVLVVINSGAFKAFWIPTAMTTMTHKYLAYTLYDETTVNKIMSENYVEQVTDEVNLDDVVIGDIKEKKHYTSKYEQEIYTRDEGNDVYKIIRLEESKYKGYLTVIYDPKDVDLTVTERIGKMGETVATQCKKHGGSIPYGAIIQDGQLIWTHPGGSGQLIGFTAEGKMWLTNDDPYTAISKGMVDAVEFGPNLIVNGKVAKIHGDGGWGTAPRTVIAQRRDGIVLFLIIEGRLPGYSIGANMTDVIEILLRYGAYNAANLDGGASSTMAVGGKLFNKPSAGGEYGGRTVSNAFIVTNKQGKRCDGCSTGA